MNNALLWALWPANQVGYRCVAWMRADRGGMMHKWFDTTDAAIRFIDAIDKAEGIGAVYHACSLFDKAKVLAIQSSTGSKFKGRDQDAVLTVNSLWVDIDVKKSTGPNSNSYTSISDAAAAAKAFISQHFVPPSFIVNSGGGLHLYWALDAPLPPDEWVVLASRLKALMQSAGFKADPTRTADAASVLRPPGTRNRKYDPPVTVTEADRGHRYPAAKLAELLQHVASELVQAVHPRTEKTNLNDDLISPPPPSSFKGVVSRCQQIRASVATLGANDSEPMWVAMLATVSKCEKVTDAVLHRISSGHPGYDPTAAQIKIDHARNLLPHLCDRFDDANPGGCDGCQYRGIRTSAVRRTHSEAHPLAPVLHPHGRRCGYAALLGAGEGRRGQLGVVAARTVQPRAVYAGAVRTQPDQRPDRGRVPVQAAERPRRLRESSTVQHHQRPEGVDDFPCRCWHSSRYREKSREGRTHCVQQFVVGATAE
jgi:hypothetical protein